MRTCGKRYYAVRVGDFVEIRKITTKPLRAIASTFTRKIKGHQMSFSQVWYEGGTVMAVWGLNHYRTSPYARGLANLDKDGYISLTEMQAKALALRRKKEIRW